MRRMNGAIAHSGLTLGTAIAMLAIGMLLGESAVLRAVAEPQQASYVLDATDDASFPDLMARAQAMATDWITRTLAENPGATEVAISVGAERDGAISPLLTVKVSRTDWQRRPDVRAWAQYLPVSAILLGFQRLGSITVAVRPAVPVRGPVNPNSEPNFYDSP